MALVVFPNSFGETAKQLAQYISARAKGTPEKPLDILVCTNTAHPARLLREGLGKYLPDDTKEYFEKNVGLIECLVIRMAVQPEQKLLDEDELVVVTNGYPELYADRTAFKGTLLNIAGIKLIENIRAEEKRKLCTYNMLHALYAYIGKTKGYTNVYECTQDEQVQGVAVRALNEVTNGLIKEYGFEKEDMHVWNERVMANMANPVLNDLLDRVGGDPIRKLKREDRLCGGALLCRKHGLLPYYLLKAIAHGFIFQSEDDTASHEITHHIRMYGIKAAIIKYTQLEHEPELVQRIAELYEKARYGKTFEDNDSEIELLKKAYHLGFMKEKTYKGCAQCTLLAMFKMLDRDDAPLFQAASGLSGGMAICNDGSCGGYVGGILLMSSLVGRKMDRMLVDGDKVDQYKSFEMAQALHDRYIETYGSVNCQDIHQRIFGTSFCLRNPEEKEAFEKAGAHADKCTSVIANASAWVTEILLKAGYIKA
jgi:mannitol-1-phosphate 5-dehydrogenase